MLGKLMHPDGSNLTANDATAFVLFYRKRLAEQHIAGRRVSIANAQRLRLHAPRRHPDYLPSALERLTEQLTTYVEAVGPPQHSMFEVSGSVFYKDEEAKIKLIATSQEISTWKGRPLPEGSWLVEALRAGDYIGTILANFENVPVGHTFSIWANTDGQRSNYYTKVAAQCLEHSGRQRRMMR
jgi:hypothetical protein